MYTVYMHTCPNGKRYIGLTSKENLQDRFHSGHGYKNNTDFNNAIIEFGWRNISHEVLASGLTSDEAEKIERDMIAFYKSNDPEYGYNSYNGGLKGTKAGKRTIARMKTAHSKERNPMFGRTQTEETRRKISMAKKGKKLSDECKKKLSRALSGEKNPSAKPVLQYDQEMNLLAIWRYIEEAAKATGANNISSCCRGKLKTSGGYVWRYLEEATTDD
nr:MAG TPA: intron associated endonuclease [Bacteriophage sp.]DAH34586.1 MAG TPA: intron associated endonuclease [Bacteriophage sp.]